MLRLCSLSFVASVSMVAAAIVAHDVRPAAAQGGLVCAYGPAGYRACCKQSYASKPSLDASSRAADIDACMAGAKKKKRG